MSPEQIERLIAKGREGILTEIEQHEIADELYFYRDAALRLENAIHSLTKEIER